MRILMLNYEYPPLGGGGGKQSMYLARELAKKHQVYFLTAGWKQFGIVKKDGYWLHRLKTSRKKMLRCSNSEMLDYVRKAWKEIPEIVKKFKPEAIHVFFTIPTGLLVFHPQIRKIPFIVSVRGSDVPGHSPDRFKVLYKAFTPIVRNIWGKAAAVVCNSDDLRKEVLRISPKLKVDVIPNGIDTEKFRPGKKRKGKELTLLYVGRLIPLKRIDIIVKALPEIMKKTGKRINLRIVGSGDQEKNLRALVKELKLEKNVTFVGEIDYDHIEKEYHKADIYVQLSKVEGMSNTILEAMASGLPVITTNVGGASVLIHRNGFVLNELNYRNQLIKLLASYFDSTDLYINQAKNSRKISRSFGINNSAESYEKRYKNSLV